MAKMGKMNIKGLKELKKQMEKMSNPDAFAEECAKELAKNLLRLLKNKTPVGDYSKEVQVTAKRDSKNHKKGETYTKRVNPTGKVGGTLRRGWTAEKEMSVSDFVNTLTVQRSGNSYIIEIINPVNYASYVEYGHRTADHKGWVKGRFMMKKSEKELERIEPKILERKMKKYLEEFLQ